MLTGPSSSTDKTHFPFISLYSKHTSGGKRGLEVVEARPPGSYLSDDVP